MTTLPNRQAIACFVQAVMLCAITAHAAAETTPRTVFHDVRIEQRIGSAIPADVLFTDDHNRPIRLGDYFSSNKPSILVLAYYTCPNLCPVVIRHLTQGLNGIGMTTGRDFQLISVSFDPSDTPALAAARKREYLRGYNAKAPPDITESGWHFLTGPTPSIERLKESTGFHAHFDDRTHTFAHSAAVMILTPSGKLSHYFFSTDIAPADLSAALQDAAADRTSKVASPDLQPCFTYDAAQNPRTLIVTRILQVAGALWAALLFGYIGHKLVAEARQARRARGGVSSSANRFTSWGTNHE
jgi:protein SCO1/2